jgi:hypothetical protein
VQLQPVLPRKWQTPASTSHHWEAGELQSESLAQLVLQALLEAQLRFCGHELWEAWHVPLESQA